MQLHNQIVIETNPHQTKHSQQQTPQIILKILNLPYLTNSRTRKIWLGQTCHSTLPKESTQDKLQQYYLLKMPMQPPTIVNPRQSTPQRTFQPTIFTPQSGKF